MKKILCLLLVGFLGTSISISEELLSGGFFVNSTPNQVEVSLIGNTGKSVQPLIKGKTYQVEKDVIEMVTKSSEEIILTFSSGLVVKTKPLSLFSTELINQFVINADSTPSVLKTDYSVTSVSLLEGEAEIISNVNSNSQCILQTPFVNVNLGKSKIYVKSNPKYVMISVVEGIISIVDSQNRTTIIDKGEMGLIIPYPGKENDIMITQRNISSEEQTMLKTSLNELESIGNETLFIIMDKKIVGISLK